MSNPFAEAMRQNTEDMVRSSAGHMWAAGWSRRTVGSFYDQAGEGMREVAESVWDNFEAGFEAEKGET